ncbi:DMT family transporter [Shewanella submarina]|uniref:DMT family transporter n=1 Tax=Shewanella submarina TaxID=2016376 RepID=A0ABV7G5Z0_9GAMM|nr:DMT family transporter [Shewanella submarina]MCL1038640.1 DMT family transporter [Shewanella submarina]
MPRSATDLHTAAPHQGLLQLHLATLLFGGTALFSRLLPLNALDITMIRAAIAAVALALLVKASRKPIRLKSLRDYGIAVLLGVLVGLHWVTYFGAMQLSSVAIGMIAFFCYPVMTVLIEPLLHGDKPAIQDVASGLVVLFGVYLLIPEASLGNKVTLGIMLGILSAMLFTARNLLHKYRFSGYSGFHAMFYQTLVAALMLLPFLEVNPAQLSANIWWLFLLLGVVFTAMPHALFTSALGHLKAKTVGLVACLQPFYGALLAYLFLGEKLQLTTFIGGTLIVATALFETAQSHRSKNALK